MRRMWDNRKFFSFYEHFESGAAVDEIIEGTKPLIVDVVHNSVVNGTFPYAALLVSRRAENEEVILNHHIGIA